MATSIASPMEQVRAKMVERTMEGLRKNRMVPHYVASRAEVNPLIQSLLKDGDIVSFGGSATLDECGVLPMLRSGPYKVLDRYAPGLTPQQLKEVFRASFAADAYFSGINAITEDGWLYAVDGNGNRIAALIYGPDKVIIVAGINKIVRDLEEAARRVEEIAGPANAIRLNLAAPCTQLGTCQNCTGDARICCSYVSLGPQRNKDRIHVILIGEPLGF